MISEIQSQEMTVVLSRPFYKVLCDFYKSKTQQYYLTRDQIGTALEYSNPQIAIGKIHDRNSDRLDKFSTLTNLVKVEGTRTVSRETIVYTLKGVMEICRFSRQPKADAFMDFVWDIMESLLTGKSTQPTQSTNPLLKQSIISLQTSQQNILECLTEQAYVLQNLEEQIADLKKNSNSNIVSLEPIDVTLQGRSLLHSVIKPLAEKWNDGSKGYNATYRKVYVAMDVNWKYRLTRFVNKNGGTVKLSKIELVASDDKLFALFKETVARMLQG